MESQIFFSFVLVILTCLFVSSQAYNFYVGGKDGWVLHPSEGYSHWAARNRFHVNDYLIFNYEKGSDSVLVLEDQAAYDTCDKSKAIRALKSGHSFFELERSGPFYFISGHGDNCDNGQKLLVVAIAPRNGTHKAPPPTPPKSPAPVLAPAPSPSVPKQPPSPSPLANPPAPEVPAPAPSKATAFGSGSFGVGLGLSEVFNRFFGML